MKHKGLLFLLLTVFLVLGAQAQAQYIKKKASDPSETHAKLVAKACIGDWEAQPCLKAVSESALVMAANYAGLLESKGHKPKTELIKEHCAAATAASREEVPAYAMKSAWIECVNKIYDIAEATGVAPDASHYQLLVGPVLCLEKDRRCGAVEEGLSRYK